MTSGARWAALFADLEAQLDAAAAAERDGTVAELTRAEQASVPLADRLRAALGRPVRVELRDGDVVDGRLAHVADAWFQVDARTSPHGVQHLVPTSAVASLAGIGPQARPSTSRTDGLGLGTALRALQRDRARVLVRTTAGTLVGRIDRVGQDHLDLTTADGAPGTARLVPFAALLRVSEG
ncbi:hypothetical protein ATJ88_2739 [Isoptericola jiangsuensis]|uniref:Uncharacterized protein n=1 Tax=Isoptericola jiangsuensis TaxID=548579 RepID=A0A2A9F0E5_9MICO|nr:hypothetical protein [Isoptericola jiangsuensis]PFG44022.1 hypothetical protein ATJ88_2739 [Isoptericola jiangsuensis]